MTLKQNKWLSSKINECTGKKRQLQEELPGGAVSGSGTCWGNVLIITVAMTGFVLGKGSLVQFLEEKEGEYLCFCLFRHSGWSSEFCLWYLAGWDCFGEIAPSRGKSMFYFAGVPRGGGVGNRWFPELWLDSFPRGLASLGVECSWLFIRFWLWPPQRTKLPGCGRWHNSWEQQITAGGGRCKGWQPQTLQLEVAITTARGNKEASSGRNLLYPWV